MSPTPLRPLAFAIALLLAAPLLPAQELPRRDRLDRWLEGDALEAGHSPHAVKVAPGAPAILPVDSEGRLVDLQVRQGEVPRAWTSEGGALFVSQPLQPLQPGHWLLDTAGRGPRWLLLEGEADVVAQARHDGERGGEDPWRVPLTPVDEGLRARQRPGARDEVLLLGAGPVAYAGGGHARLRFDVWRTQVPRQLPPDASWLRIEADGRLLFEGLLPTPPTRDQMMQSEDFAQTLELAGRLHLALPPDARAVRIQGEPGTWLKVLGPLPGTPATALARDADPVGAGLVPAPGEALPDAFSRAVAAWPDRQAVNFLARHGYYRPVAVRPTDARLETRRWRERLPDRTPRGDQASNRPEPGAVAVGATEFHWLAPGVRWRLDLSRGARLGLLRIAVAHPPAPAPPARLELEQAGAATRQLRLEPRVIAALADASAAADPLLALQPEGAPIVESSQVVLPVHDLAQPLHLANTGDTGLWVAVEQRVPAHRRLAEAALAPSMMPASDLRAALVAPGSPAADLDGTPRLANTRAINAARQLLRARAEAFASDPCALAGIAGAPTAQAAHAAAAVGATDPVLTRCATLLAAAAAPEDGEAWKRLDAWGAGTQRHDLRTGFWAWSLQDPGRRGDPARWRHLADALEAEGEFDDATLARRAAGDAPPVDALQAPTALPPDTSDGTVHLRTARQSELAYALALRQPIRWSLPQPGEYLLELRSNASSPERQWATLESGAGRWHAPLPSAVPSLTQLRGLGDDGAPGLAVRIRLRAMQAGSTLLIHPGSAPVLARIQPVEPTPDPAPEAGDRTIPSTLVVASQGHAAALRAAIPIVQPRTPESAGDPVGAVSPLADGPWVADVAPSSGVATPVQAVSAAVQALWLLEHGQPEAGLVAAARALHLREQHRGNADAWVWSRLDAATEWRLVEPVASQGRVRRLRADGHSNTGLIARRDELAGIVDEADFVLRPGQAWVLDGLPPRQRVRLQLHHRAALGAGSVQWSVGGAAPQRLAAGQGISVEHRADADGALRLRLGAALPGSAVTLRVAAADGVPFDARRGIVYHRAPYALRLEHAALLRITEWDGRRSATRLQWAEVPGDLVLSPQQLPGAALRVSRLALTTRPAREGTRVAEAEADASALATPPPSPPAYVPAPNQPASWPADFAQHGGDQGTWGLLGTWRKRTDSDDPEQANERFGEIRWRHRRHWADAGIWSRFDAVARGHTAGFEAFGLRQSLQWRQQEGPWGASLDAGLWQQSAPAGLRSPARAVDLRANVEWQRQRNERWRDEWRLGLRWRGQSLKDVPRALRADLDNDVYSAYRDRHREQLELGHTLSLRTRYDTEWVLATQALSNPLAQAGLDNIGTGLEWRWAREGWTASAGVNVRRYFRDSDRGRGFQRERIELDLGKLFLGYRHGWRLSAGMSYEPGMGDLTGGMTLEWFDHDGRGLEDWLPSELFLRGVTTTDLVTPLLRSGAPP